MTTSIGIQPAEKGTAIVTLGFTDEDGAVVVPTNLAWQLMRSNGVVVNGRTFATGSFSGVTIVLSGDDLAILSRGDSGYRILSIQGIYTSSAGVDLPLKGECKFSISRFVGVT